MIQPWQANIGDQWDILEMRPPANVGDHAALHTRRVLRKLIALEAKLPESAPALVS